MDFEKSETKKNLEKALQGEALAHLKYQFYKSKLIDYNKKYENIFDEIIHNEKEHGKIWFKHLYDGIIPLNKENILDAISGEQYECNEMYKEFGKIAKKEGFDKVANLFLEIAKIECHHAETFNEILNEIEDKDIFESEMETTQWKCLNCGHIVEGYSAPLECPVCEHPQKYFVEINGE